MTAVVGPREDQQEPSSDPQHAPEGAPNLPAVRPSGTLVAPRRPDGAPTPPAPTWWQRLDATDPGSVRLVLSVRAVVNLGVVLAVNDLIARALGLTGTAMIVMLVLGAVLGMITTFTTSDPTRTGRIVTQLCLPVAMIATLALATLVDKHRVLSLGAFVAVMFVVVWVRRFGPRAFACGMVAWIGYFIALFLQLSFAMLPNALVAIGAATAVMLVLNTVLAPMAPGRRLRRMVDAFTARVAIARHDGARGRHGVDEHALSTALQRVNEVAVLVDGQLGMPGAVRRPSSAPGVRAAMLRVELALSALLEEELDAVPDPATARELDRALERLAEVLVEDTSRDGPDTAEPPDPPAFTPGTDLFAGFLPGSAATVGAMFDPPEDAEDTDDTGTTERSRDTDRSDARRPRDWWRHMSLTTRQAVQITIASALAIVVGDALNGQRWYWAVLACFLAFTGTATSAETARKAGQRTVGTLVGVVIALPLLPLLGHSVPIALIVMMVALFVGFYFFRVSYTVLAFAVTILVAEMYELMGQFSEGLLWLRVTETLVGAAVGGIVAISVLPTASRDAETAARAQLAEDLRDALVAVVHRVRRTTVGDDHAELHERLRVLDAGVHQLAVIGVPLRRREIPGTGIPRQVVRRRLTAWVTCAMRVRAVAHAVEDAPAGRVPGHPQVARAIASVRELAEGISLGRPDGGRHRPTGGAGGTDGAHEDPNLLRELSALDGALVALQEIDGRTEQGRAVRSGPGGLTGPRLSGATRTGDGEPLTEVVVTLVDANGRQQGLAHAVDGRYELTLPAPGTWQLIAGAPGHAPRADRVLVGAAAHEVVHDLVLEPAPRPARLVDPTGGLGLPLAGS